jgi:hypothetical protein
MMHSFVTQCMARLKSDELALEVCAWIIRLKRTKDNEAPAIDAINTFTAIAWSYVRYRGRLFIIFSIFAHPRSSQAQSDF